MLTDQLGRKINISAPPQRIISLVPSQTELLFDLGLENSIVGITKFCIHPASKVRQYPIVGGTKNLRLSTIIDLQPDLILANKEENEKGQIQQLEEKFPVWVSDVSNLEDAFQMIAGISRATGTELMGQQWLETLQDAQRHWHQKAASLSRLRVAYLIWKSPLMVAGSQTFIQAMLDEAGFINVFQDRPRYPEISSEELLERSPDLIFLSSEPYPFSEKHLAEFRAMAPHSKIKMVDGEMFSWYGSRLLKSFTYFEQLRDMIP